jgi:hypothetical protein
MYVVAACGTQPRTPGIPGTPSLRPSSSPGWQVLFDGGSTDAFRAYGGPEFPARWVVDGDSLATVPGPTVDLVTRETYDDFELEFEWRVAPGGNSGVMYRVAETGQPSWTSGPEYQVLDDAGHPDGRRPETSAAALYDLVAPDAGTVLAPVGEYNEARIVVRDDRVEHWLNGKRALAYQWGGPEIRALVAASKFRDLPGFMAEADGHIVLQHHGEAAWFRQVRIRPLRSG